MSHVKILALDAAVDVALIQTDSRLAKQDNEPHHNANTVQEMWPEDKTSPNVKHQ